MKINIDKAVSVLRDGGIVIFPTDTVWGIGCRFDCVESVKKLYEIRKRPVEKAVPVLVSSVAQASLYYQNIDAKMLELVEKYWPGGLTVVAECNFEKVIPEVRGGGATIGLRMPNNDVLLEIISKVGVPILGPSANFSGEKTPTKRSELNPELVSLVDFVVEGECGGNLASTVIDCSKNPWQIIRQGAIEIDQSFLV